MPTPRRYRRRARQLTALAELATDDTFRKTYLDTASRFRAIADGLERGEPLDQIARAPNKRREARR
jgi:hypothetical protein